MGCKGGQAVLLQALYWPVKKCVGKRNCIRGVALKMSKMSLSMPHWCAENIDITLTESSYKLTETISRIKPHRMKDNTKCVQYRNIWLQRSCQIKHFFKVY